MSIQLHIDGTGPEDILYQVGQLFPQLAGKAFVPTVANEALKQAAAADDVKTGEIIEPEKPKRVRRNPSNADAASADSSSTASAAKISEAKNINAATSAARSEAETGPLDNASTAESQESSTQSEQETSSESASDAPSVPDVQVVRDKLKKLGATDGLGHEAAFKVLGKYGAKNASTVPEDKRAALIAEIDELLAGAE